MGDAVAVTVTCPTCGAVWETTSRSGRTRCPNRHRVYVPAATRSRAPGASSRAVSRAPSSAPVVVTAERTVHVTTPCCRRPMIVELSDADDTSRVRLQCPCGVSWRLSELLAERTTAYDETRPTGARRSGRPRPYVSSAPVQTPRPGRSVPAPVQPAVGAAGRWSCGHEQTVATADTARQPQSSRCRQCGARGLVAQLTPGGWAPVDGAEPEQARAQTNRRPSRPVTAPRFAGVPSPSAWPAETGWQPVEDRRPQGAADPVAVPRLRSPGAVPGRRDVVPGTSPHH